MKAQELLNPRFEVIEKYPHSQYKVGDILELKEITTSKIFHNDDEFLVGNYFKQDELESFPHLFRKLNWWEHRKKEDMPKKLICKAIKDDNEVMEILDWDMNNLFGWTDVENRKGCGLLSFNPEYGYFPVD